MSRPFQTNRDVVIVVKYRLREGAELLEHDGSVALVSPSSILDGRRLSNTQLDLVRALLAAESTVEELMERVVAAVAGDRALVVDLIEALDHALWLTTFFYADERRLFRVDPVSSAQELRNADFGSVSPDFNDDFAISTTRLSRFVSLTPSERGFVVQSPLCPRRVTVEDPRSWAALYELATQTSGELLPVAVVLLKQLARCGFLVEREGREETDLALRQWSRHDLVFHSLSRRGRHENPFGGTYWARGRFAPLPSVPAPLGATLTLPVPSSAELAAHDMSLNAVLDLRSSIREYGGRPISLGQLAEFLYRCARVERRPSSGGGHRQWRPYPSAGGLYETELYVNAIDVDGLPRGLYHYAGTTHSLEKVTDDQSIVSRIARDAMQSTASSALPQVVVLLSARFGRVMWKYESIGYSLILKDVGVLYMIMYQVATAMGLAACALGGGNSDLFSLARGVPHYEETTVGEFVLGTRPANASTEGLE